MNSGGLAHTLCCTKRVSLMYPDYRYIKMFHEYIFKYPLSLLINGFATRITLWLPLVEHGLKTFWSSPPVVGSCSSIFNFLCSLLQLSLLSSFFLSVCVKLYCCPSSMYGFRIVLLSFVDVRLQNVITLNTTTRTIILITSRVAFVSKTFYTQFKSRAIDFQDGLLTRQTLSNLAH